ncbi:hypothetical protein HPB47_024681, partial [Ixodes persulcatus]
MDPSAFYRRQSVSVRRIPSESEDSELSGDDDPEYVPAGHVLDSDTESEPETLDSDAISSFGHSTASTSCQRATQGAPGPLGGKKVQQRPVWKTVNTSTTCVDFKGSEDLPQCILNMETPYEFFKYYCTSSLTELIVEQSNLYSVQHSPNSPLSISLKERATLSLCLFKAQVAEALCKAGKADRPKRGRPSKEVEARFEAKKHRGPAKPLPCKDARLDGISHLPIMTAQRG